MTDVRGSPRLTQQQSRHIGSKMVQQKLPLGRIALRVPANFLPWAWQVEKAPEVILPQILHRTIGGGFRSAGDCSRLAAGVRSGNLCCDDLYMPVPTDLKHREEEILLPPALGRQSPQHRGLVLLGHLFLLASDPLAEVEHEVQLGNARTDFRVDLMAWDRYGLISSVEAGATDGRSVMAQLEAGHVRVLVLPFAGLADGILRGYAFRLPATPPLPPVPAAKARLALSTLRRQRHHHLALAA